MRFQLQASVAGSLILEKGPGCYVYEHIEVVPDWVHIRYVPLEKWDYSPIPPVHLISPKQGLSLTDHRKLTTSGVALSLLRDGEDASGKNLSQIIKDVLVSDMEADTNFVAVIVRDSKENRASLTEFTAKLVASGDSYWVSAPSPDGGTKMMQLGAWFTQAHFVAEKETMIKLGNFSEGNPIIEFRVSDMMVKVSAPDSVNSEYAARDLLCKILGLSENDFEYEPNGTATFPDWSMSCRGQIFNVEVTRVKEEVKKIVQMDVPNWPDQVDGVRRSRPRPADHTKLIQRKADRATSGNSPTILVVFSEIGNLSYEDIDLQAFFAVFEIDENTYAGRLIMP